jgi:hypothetical protein
MGIVNCRKVEQDRDGCRGATGVTLLCCVDSGVPKQEAEEVLEQIFSSVYR